MTPRHDSCAVMVQIFLHTSVSHHTSLVMIGLLYKATPMVASILLD